VGWLDLIRSAPAGGSGYQSVSITDADGRRYSSTYSGGVVTDGGETPGQLVGYTGADGGEWYQGKLGTLYDVNGQSKGTFEIKDPNARDWGELAALGIIAIATGGAAYGALGGGAAGGGAVATGGGSGAFLGEGALSGVAAWDGALSAASTATAGAVGGSGAFLGEGMASGVPAWDAAAINSGLTLTTPATVASTVVSSAPSTISQAATSGGGLANTLTGAAATVGKLVGAAASLAGLAGAGGGAGGGMQLQPMGTGQAPGAASLGGIGLGTALLIGGAILLGAFALKKKG
jgi:hypothetical protein